MSQGTLQGAERQLEDLVVELGAILMQLRGMVVSAKTEVAPSLAPDYRARLVERRSQILAELEHHVTYVRALREKEEVGA